MDTGFISVTVAAVVVLILVILILFYFGGRGCCKCTERTVTGNLGSKSANTKSLRSQRDRSSIHHYYHQPMGTGDYSRVDIGYMQPPKALEYKSSYKLSDYCRSCNSTKSIYHHSHAISNRYERSFSKKCSNLVAPIFVFRTNSSTLPTSITEPLLHPSQSNSSRSIIPFTNKQLNEAAISDGVRGSTTKPNSNSSKNDSLRYSFRSFKWKPRTFTVRWALLRPPSTLVNVIYCPLTQTVRFQLSSSGQSIL